MARFLLFIVSFLPSLPCSTYQDNKLPVPNAADQKKAEKEIREAFPKDFADKSRNGKSALAQKLLGQSADDKNTPTSRYVVLLLSRDLATESLDLTTAFDAIERLNTLFQTGAAPLTGATFTVERNSWKAAALNAARKNASTPEDVSSLADAYIKFATDSVGEKNFADALIAAQLADQYAKASKAAGAVDKTGALLREIPELRKEEDQFSSIIISKADDPQARLVKGRYVIFVVNDVDRGIEALLGCSDQGLNAVARMELAKPTTAQAMVEIAETWLALSKKEENPLHKRRYLDRAVVWFEQAAKNAGGIARAKIEKRISETAARKAVTPVNLLREYELGKWKNLIQGRGEWSKGKDGYTFKPVGGGGPDFGWSYPLPKSLTAFSVKMVFRVRDVGGIQIVFVDKKDIITGFGVALAYKWHEGFSVGNLDSRGPDIKTIKLTKLDKGWHTLDIKVTPDSIVAKLDNSNEVEWVGKFEPTSITVSGDEFEDWVVSEFVLIPR